MERICTAGKGFKTESGSTVVLRGMAIPDIVVLQEKEKIKPETAIRLVKSTGANCIRIPVLPGHILVISDFLARIDPLVNLAEELGLYCILDWHAIGNPLRAQTRLQQYYHMVGDKRVFWFESDFSAAKQGIEMLAKRYGTRAHVLFEVYNEPAPGEKDIKELGLSALPWEEWRMSLKELVSLVRKHSDNIILLSPTTWAYRLDLVMSHPVEGENIAYTFHIYPVDRHTQWQQLLEKCDFPVILTEWGYDADNQGHQYHGSRGHYGQPLIQYCQKNGISWIAWCLSTSWRPRLLKSWTPEWSDFGNLVIESLNDTAGSNTRKSSWHSS